MTSASMRASSRPPVRKSPSHRSCCADCAMVSYSAASLADRCPLVLLSGDRFVGGQFGAGVLEDPVEDGSCGVLQVVTVLVLLDVVLVGHDVGTVCFSAPGEGDVERFAGHLGAGDDGVRGVDGGALCAVRRDRVTEIDVLGDVPGGKSDGAAPPVLSRRTVREPSSAVSVTIHRSLFFTHPRPRARRRSFRRVMTTSPVDA